jgi:hypothetical protein
LTAEFQDLSRYQTIAETTVVSGWVFPKQFAKTDVTLAA